VDSLHQQAERVIGSVVEATVPGVQGIRSPIDK
jgi:hypothetical protein